MNAYKMILVLASMFPVATFASEDALPRFVEAVDKCESMWRAREYAQLYDYIGDFDQKYQGYLPAKLLLAVREEVFGAQYETGVAILTDLTNQVCRVICEINPELHHRIGEMIGHMAEEAEFCLEDNEDIEFRRKNEDPRRCPDKKPIGTFWPLVFVDVPLYGSDITLRETCQTDNNLVQRPHDKPLTELDLGKAIFRELFCFNAKSNTVASYCHKKDLLDDYVFGFMATAGAKGLVENFNDGFVKMDGHYALDQLRKKFVESKHALMDYVAQNAAAKDADAAMRMAVWALLQFAHDDPEVADYLRHLPPKIDKRCWKTSEYLGLAIKHLDEGCNRHFLDRVSTTPSSGENTKSTDRETERKK